MPSAAESNPVKKIAALGGPWLLLARHRDSNLFVEDGCPVSRCRITDDKEEADLVLTRGGGVTRRSDGQIWVHYELESPRHSTGPWPASSFDWMANYRSGSTLVAPYEKWVYYDDRVRAKEQRGVNFAANKTSKVAWFVSNCNAANGRDGYAKDLKK